MSELEKDKSRAQSHEDDFDLDMDDGVVTDAMLGYSELDDELQNIDDELSSDMKQIDSELDDEFLEIGNDEEPQVTAAPAVAASAGEAEDEALSPVFGYFKPAFIAGLIVYSLYLLSAKAPAELAAWAVHKALPSLWFSSVQGSLWDGRAGNAQIDIGSQTLALGAVSWSLDPLSILLLKPCVHFASDLPGQSVSGNVCQSPFGVTSINDLTVEAPVSAINQWLPVDASGQLSLNVLAAETSGKTFSQLDARFSWANARIVEDGNMFVLGSFGGELQADTNGAVLAKLFDVDGPFSVQGNAMWNPQDNAVKLEGTVIPKPGAPDMVVQALQVIGEDAGGGAFKIVFP